MAQYKGAASEAGRAMQLMKKREKEREQLEQLKQKIAEVWNPLDYNKFNNSSVSMRATLAVYKWSKRQNAVA